MTQAAQLAQYGSNNVGLSFKNRIINGDMTIDQRNGGAEINPAVNNTYSVDRWNTNSSSTGVYRVQQNAGSVTPPAGFTNYLGVTSLGATSLGVGDSYSLNQRIEGFNTADLAWGTVNASTVTLSAWVRSSLTGMFGGAVTNGNLDRSYAFSYSIPTANTWTKISVTIPGDTTGTWATTNTTGIFVWFSLGMGSGFSTAAGVWQGLGFRSVTGATSVVGTSGATFYITGVQLEKGSVATSFDYLPYTTELQLCQRYYEPNYTWTVAAYTNTGLTNGNANPSFLVQKRTTPTMTLYPQTAGGTQGAFPSTTGFLYFDNTNATKQLGSSSNTIAWIASAEL